MPAAIEVVTTFVSAYTTGDAERAVSMVGPDYTLSTPAQESADASAREELAGYISHIAPFARGHRMLRQWADGQDVCSWYDLLLEPPGGPVAVRISEWDVVRDGKIASSVLVFDTTAVGGGGAVPATAIDPVCHMRVDPAVTAQACRRQLADEEYYFCSVLCAQRFEAHPDRYLASLPR